MSPEHSGNGHDGNAGKSFVRSPRQQALLALFAESEQPLSTSQLARLTGQTLGATAHHVRHLAHQQLIQWAGERRARGAVQTFYKASENGHAALRRTRAEALLFLAGALASSVPGRPVMAQLDDEAIQELDELIDRLRPELAALLRGE